MIMTRCPFLPFLEYEHVTDEEVNCFTIEVVTFTQDFGPYKKGDKADSLSFDFISGTCIEFCLSDIETYGGEVRRFDIRCYAIFGTNVDENGNKHFVSESLSKIVDKKNAPNN